MIMTIAGGTKLPDWLLAGMEKQYVVENLEALTECDAVVVLGGGQSFEPKAAFGIEFNGAADRIIMGVELVRLGKGNALLIGGAGFPSTTGVKSEGILLKNWIKSWDVIDKPIFDLGVNYNTKDEALKVVDLAQKKNGIKSFLSLPPTICLALRHFSRRCTLK